MAKNEQPKQHELGTLQPVEAQEELSDQQLDQVAGGATGQHISSAKFVG